MTDVVVDASTVLAALLGPGPSRTVLTGSTAHAPAHLDVEVAGVLRREVRLQRISAQTAGALLSRLAKLGLRRHEVPTLLPRMWALRDNVIAADAAYVALAERLGCALVTGDRRLAGAPGPRCEITVVHG